jgi:formate hydrogenlyase subunit 3/multisubunit Na+/H+ antiporter MnhD subunit
MGVVAAVIGMGIAQSVEGTSLHAAFYAVHHVLAKGALFLGVGVALMAGPRARLLVLPLALALALGFGGLPPTGGALAKAAVKEELGTGIAAWCAALSALGSTLLMLHFVNRVWQAAREAPPGPVARAILLAWIGLATGALIGPWLLAGMLAEGAAEKLWSASALAPVLAGVALSFAWRRWGDRVPAVPEGDVLVLLRRGAGPPRAAAALVARIERVFLAWPSAGLALLAVILALLAAMLSAGPA